MTLHWPPKDPNEILDYDIDWTDRLDGDTIASSTWTVDVATITMDSDSYSTTGTKLWLSSGVVGTSYLFTNRIVTAGARTMDQSVRLRTKER